MMNLRDKFLWNALLMLSFIVLALNIYYLYGKSNDSKKAYSKYYTDKNEVGTDPDLEKKLNELENIYVSRNEMKFIMLDNPVDLTKVISVSGMTGSKRRKSFWVSGIINRPNSNPMALISYKDATYNVVKGDSIAGGVILDITSTNVVFEKNEKIQNFNLGINQNIE